jgi:hypothetical protein
MDITPAQYQTQAEFLESWRRVSSGAAPIPCSNYPLVTLFRDWFDGDEAARITKRHNVANAILKEFQDRVDAWLVPARHGSTGAPIPSWYRHQYFQSFQILALAAQPRVMDTMPPGWPFTTYAHGFEIQVTCRRYNSHNETRKLASTVLTPEVVASQDPWTDMVGTLLVANHNRTILRDRYLIEDHPIRARVDDWDRSDMVWLQR